jgi:hypothetical protein
MSTDLTPDQIEFTNAFNNQRGTLAGFAKCANQEELDIVRDGFYLGLASDLCPKEYDPVSLHVVMDSKVAESVGTSEGFAETIQSARASEEWNELVQAVRQKANAVGSDLDDIWKTLEMGRLEWLGAATAAHGIKTLLKKGLEKDGTLEDSPGDVSDAKMIWIYGLCLNLPELKAAAITWAKVVGLPDPTKPLVGYNPTLWDPRKDEWRPLDLGAQAAAERGGSTLDEAWNA